MPFNGSGVFGLPAGSIVSNGQTADASQHNDPLNDIAAAINEITGGTQEFIGPVAAPNGTALLPAFTFSTDPNTGIYRTAADSIGFSTGGTLRLTLSTTALTSTLPLALSGVLTVTAGSAAAPAITTTGDTNTGILFPAADQVAIATGGTQRLLVTDTYMDFNGGSVLRDGYARGTQFIYTATGSHTISSRVRALLIEFVGAGGGGGGVDGQGAGTTAMGGSGGGGAFQRIYTTVVAQTVSFTIAAGGAGGAAGNNPGSTGGSTTVTLSVDGVAVCGGGGGGDGELATAGAGASQGGLGGTTLTTIAKTVYASEGQTATPALRSASGTRLFGSIAGGNVMFCVSQRTIFVDGAGNNGVAGQYGTGGIGASVSGVATNYAGGTGVSGAVFITEFF